jgi:hypothetical protein
MFAIGQLENVQRHASIVDLQENPTIKYLLGRVAPFCGKCQMRPKGKITRRKDDAPRI